METTPQGQDVVLRFVDAQGIAQELQLGPDPVTLGRAPEAGLLLAGENISRVHCEIRWWNGDYVIKDLHSKNGTYVNNRLIDVAVLALKDTIRVGSVQLHVDHRQIKGPQTSLREVQKEMEDGKGYKTILREIVQSAEPPGEKPR